MRAGGRASHQPGTRGSITSRITHGPLRPNWPGRALPGRPPSPRCRPGSPQHVCGISRICSSAGLQSSHVKRVCVHNKRLSSCENDVDVVFHNNCHTSCENDVDADNNRHARHNPWYSVLGKMNVSRFWACSRKSFIIQPPPIRLPADPHARSPTRPARPPVHQAHSHAPETRQIMK